MQEQRLETLCYWVRKHSRLNLAYNAALFMLEVAQAEAMKMVNELEEAQEKKPDPKLPDKFKINSKWLVWEEQ